jgi:hypothetical protein
VVTPERSKTIIARNDSPDVGFNRSINPYRGCEHGCIYWVVTHPLARAPGTFVGQAWSGTEIQSRGTPFSPSGSGLDCAK